MAKKEGHMANKHLKKQEPMKRGMEYKGKGHTQTNLYL